MSDEPADLEHRHLTAALLLADDWPAINARLRVLLTDGESWAAGVVRQVNAAACDHDWDEMRTLKTALVMLAAHDLDLQDFIAGTT